MKLCACRCVDVYPNAGAYESQTRTLDPLDLEADCCKLPDSNAGN